MKVEIRITTDGKASGKTVVTNRMIQGIESLYNIIDENLISEGDTEIRTFKIAAK